MISQNSNKAYIVENMMEILSTQKLCTVYYIALNNDLKGKRNILKIYIKE